MKEFYHTNPDYCDPPGAFSEILAHPIHRKTKAIEQATFKEHRFAFFYWSKWLKELKTKTDILNPPTLISIDYHRDLAGPNESEKKELLEIEKYNNSELALFCWARMNPLNDGHILSAAFINIIGDIILLNKNESFVHKDELSYKDHFGNKHFIYEFDNLNHFESFISDYQTENIFFDIDLDYFISTRGHYMNEEGYIVMSDKEISSIINPSRTYIKKIYKHLEGLTIATEQKHCGGTVNSFKILSVIENQLFSDGKKWK